MSKTIKITVITLLLVVCLTLSYSAGCTLGNKTSQYSDEGLGAIKEAWDIIFHDYVDLDRLDASTLRQGAIKGMVEALDDPHTAYLDAEATQKWLFDLEGKYDGIGAYVGIKDEQLIIVAPFANSPAAKAGIRASDVILEINGISTSGLSVAEAVIHIRGPKGTYVNLLILHQGETEPEEIKVVRAEIEIPSVYFEMKGDMAYISISYFSERTDIELSRVLESVTQESATGIILDLRGNPGGLLDTVIDVASRFIQDGVIVNKVDNQDKYTTFSVRHKDVITDLPMVVLVDSYSASGSEVLAGALQDYIRATIAGTTTHGKGSVNILRQLEDDSGLYITTARWLTPYGRPIEGKGIEPDYELDFEGEDAIQWAMNYLKSNK